MSRRFTHHLFNLRRILTERKHMFPFNDALPVKLHQRIIQRLHAKVPVGADSILNKVRFSFPDKVLHGCICQHYFNSSYPAAAYLGHKRLTEDAKEH